MVRNYKRKTLRFQWSRENLEKAAISVRSGELSIGKAAKAFDIPKGTLARFLTGKVNTGQRGTIKPVFTQDQEAELEGYLIKCRDTCHGLTTKIARKLAYMYAERNSIHHRFNRTLKMAGKEWLRSFLKRHPSFSLRTPVPTAFNEDGPLSADDALEDWFKVEVSLKDSMSSQAESSVTSGEGIKVEEESDEPKLDIYENYELIASIPTKNDHGINSHLNFSSFNAEELSQSCRLKCLHEIKEEPNLNDEASPSPTGDKNMVQNIVNKPKRFAWSMENLKKAAQSVKNDSKSLRKAGKAYGIPHSTLSRHLSGKVNSGQRGRIKPVFTKDQEDELAAMCYGLTSTSMRKAAYELAERHRLNHPFNHSHKMAGREWLRYFLKRRPEICFKIEATALSDLPGFGSDPEQAESLSDSSGLIMEAYNCYPDQIHILDESVLSSNADVDQIVTSLFAREKIQVALEKNDSNLQMDKDIRNITSSLISNHYSIDTPSIDRQKDFSQSSEIERMHEMKIKQNLDEDADTEASTSEVQSSRGRKLVRKQNPDFEYD